MTVYDGSELSSAELVALVESSQVFVDAALDLLDSDDVFIADITDDYVAAGSSVERGIYRTIHGTATLNISREGGLQWGSQRLRPWLLLSANGTDWYRWPLGIFLPTIPERVVGESPSVWSVQCFDKLDVLNTPIGSAVSVAASANVVDTVVALIEGEGEQAINITPSTATAGSVRVYSLADGWTTLTVVNDLLGSIGFRGLYADTSGAFVSEPYVAPSDLPVVWDYSTASATSTVGQARTSVGDYYQAANEVIGILDAVSGDLPSEAAATIYTASNGFDGPTSVSARGRTIRKVISGQFADADALAVAVNAALDVEKRVAQHVNVTVSPTPVLGHFDAVNFRDDDLAVNGRFVVTDWVCPLDGGDVSLAMRAV